MRRVELPNNTDEQVADYIERAAKIADEHADGNVERWKAIFRAAYDGYSGKQILMEQPHAVDLSSILQNGRR